MTDTAETVKTIVMAALGLAVAAAAVASVVLLYSIVCGVALGLGFLIAIFAGGA